MKFHHILSCLFFAAITRSTALTESDINPTGLSGKTLTFTINQQSSAPFATTGSWSGTFGPTPGSAFTVKNLNGNTVESTGTWTFNSSFAGMYEYTITSFIVGQPDAIMTLWISNGSGSYEIFLSGMFGVSQTGSFTLGAAVTGPEINIAQPVKSPLIDGKGIRAFGRASLGKPGSPKTFTIKNTGTSTLSGLAITKIGASKSDFIVTDPGKKSLAAGASTTFKVSFNPKARGTRKATIRVVSNDKDENPFDIAVSGFGIK